MGIFCSKSEIVEKQESIFNVMRKITNTIRDLNIKEMELTKITMPKKKKNIMELHKQGRREQALISFKTYKKLQNTRDKYWRMKENLELVRHELDTQQTNIVVTEGFKKANQIMEEALEKSALKDVDTIIDKCREHMQNGSELFNELTISLNGITGEEEEEQLEKEMEGLMKRNIDVEPRKDPSILMAEGVGGANIITRIEKNESCEKSPLNAKKKKKLKNTHHKGTLREPLLT